ncbi:MAG: hypothetical protein IGS48_02845 [Oscillatoriales cyanobacterium C42_A2020_001]|nr:hypothetical protein [Leptolyngbyaceae cyanobacterium C42_A2020_001]
MHLLTSTLLAGVLLTFSVMVPSVTAQSPSSNLSILQFAPTSQVAPLHVVKRSQPRHRGSGRRELVSCVETWLI